MTELGNRLKEARLAKGLSLDDLQTITKIQKRYLMGIEEGDYSTMPGNFYVRAFIKQYAEAVQVDPEEIFQSYKDEIPTTLNEDLPEQLSRVKSRKTISDRSPRIFDFLPKLLIGIVVIGAAALIYYFLQHNAGTSANNSVDKQAAPVQYAKSKNLEKAKSSDSQTKNSKKAKSDQKNSQPQTPAQPQPQQQAIAVVQSAGSQTTYQLTNADKFVVKLVSRGNSWVSIKNSQGVLQFQGVLKAGAGDTQQVDLSNDTTAVIRVGNASVTDLYVNDQKVDYAVPPTQVTVQNITIQYVPKNK